ncbi:DoxX family protein [Paenibacillus aestuarii]|uniref:DoxX family protein n=1 Tax=Paenibacillus aestuarii TaxID=516965 RepID=A0ABW0KHM7_9BACL|nr:DoxX family protein [Paenibacillus aestuarii]
MNNRSFSNYAPLLIRIVIGISFILHGIPKLTNLAGTTQFFSKVGIPMAGIAAPVIGILEVIGGLALILGLFVEIFSILLTLDMIGAILAAKSGKGWVGGFELELLLGITALSLLFSGPGAFSVTKGLLLKRSSI